MLTNLSRLLMMPKPKQGGSRFGGRLFKSAAQSALALTAVAGGLIMSGGTALAFNIDFNSGALLNPTYGARWNPPVDPDPPYGLPYFNPGPNPGPLPGLLANPGPVPAGIVSPFTKQWYDTNFGFASYQQPSEEYFFPTDKQIWFVDNNTLKNPVDPITSGQGGPSRGVGDVEWRWVDANGNGDWRIPPDPHSVDQWHVDVDFNPDYNTTFDQPSTFDYVIRIVDRSVAYPDFVPPPAEGNQYFEDVALTVSAVTPPAAIPSVVDKYIYEAVFRPASNDYTPGKLIKKLSVAGAGQAFYSLFDNQENYDILYIRDDVTPNGSTIDNYQNSYRQAPGPLSVLGAGAAFGFSRKLRARIKASRAA